MSTATAARWDTPAARFAVRALAWGLGLFGLLRLPWIETHGVLPATAMQGRMAAAMSGAATLPVDVTLACSGTDVLAMCAGAILAYPARWRSRLAGAAFGVALILALNIVRIATLARAAGSPLFDVLHLYVWPAALALTAAAYVFWWMRAADRPAAPAARPQVPAPARRFVLLASALIVIFALASPLYLESAWLLAVAGFIARAAAGVLNMIGVAAVATGNLLITPRGGFAVTQECISTPLIPLYIAAVVAYRGSWRHRLPALLAVVPIFVALGVARLLVVALPAALVESPLFFVHAFYQLLTAAALVCAAALWRQDSEGRGRRAAAGVAAGAVCLLVLGPLVSRTLAAGPAFEDPQGAVALLPAFQIALLVALWAVIDAPRRWRALAAGLAVLAVSHVALFAALHTWGGFGALAAHVAGVRAWSLAAPLALVAAASLRFRRDSRRCGPGWS